MNANGITVVSILVRILFIKRDTRRVMAIIWLWCYTVVSSTVIHYLLGLKQYSTCPVIVYIPVEVPFVGVHHCSFVICYGHHFGRLESHLVWNIAPSIWSSVQIHTSLVEGALEFHVLCHASDLDIAVFPDESPSSSISRHITVHLYNVQYVDGVCKDCC